MAKLDFGVSIDENLVYVLDKVAAKAKVSRSELIQRILAEHLSPTAETRLEEIEAAAIEAVKEAIGQRLAVIQAALGGVNEKLAQAHEEKERVQNEINALAAKLDVRNLAIDEVMELKRKLSEAKERLVVAEEVIQELNTRLKDIETQKASLLKEGWRVFVEVYETEAFAVIDEEIRKLAERVIEVRNTAHRVLSRTRELHPEDSTTLLFDRLFVLASEKLPEDAWNRELRRKNWARKMSGDSPALDPDVSLLDWVKARRFDIWPNGLADEDLAEDLSEQ